MAPKDVPEFLLHSEVLDSGCEVHIADETGFLGYEVKPTEDSKSGRGSRVADGKVIPNKGGAIFDLKWMVGMGRYIPFPLPSRSPRCRTPSGQ